MPTKILAIDDSKTMRLAVKITFAAEDADVTSVSKGSDAVARAKQLAPDVILVDSALGEGEPSGYDVCQSLKSDPATQGTPVLLMVSNQSGVDQARFDAVGADGFIHKPFDTQDLIDKVNAASGGASKPAPATAPAAKAAPASKAVPASKPAAARPAPRTAAPPKPAVPKAAPRPAAAAPRPAVPKPAAPKPAAARPAPRPTPAVARPAAAATGPIPIAVPIPFTAADSPTPGMLDRLSKAAGDAGIDPKVAEALAALSREVIESVVWEVVPHLAEEIIKKQAQSA